MRKLSAKTGKILTEYPSVKESGKRDNVGQRLREKRTRKNYSFSAPYWACASPQRLPCSKPEVRNLNLAS